jgi:hypothetical protein
MKTATFPTSRLIARSHGFSFFEMMMFVAIIGVMVAMTVPLWGNNDAFYAARDRRNAQELVAVSTMAAAAGLNFVHDERGQPRQDLVGILSDISHGESVKTGALKGRHFSVPGLSKEDIAGAASYVIIANGELRYSYDRRENPRGSGSL